MDTKTLPYAEAFAQKVIEQLEQGTAPWIKPWKESGYSSLPINALTGKTYQGANAIGLSMQQDGQADNRWCTYKQAQSLNAQVIKGSKGTLIQYWQFDEVKLKRDENLRPLLNEQGEKQYEQYSLERPRVILSTVFHASQISGLAPLIPLQISHWETHQKIENLLHESGAKIQHDRIDDAFYGLSSDTIHLPKAGLFETADRYYATVLHELGHWTGHASRLNRDLSGNKKSSNYAQEELRAELASYMLGMSFNIGHDPGQHLAYVNSWIKALKNDPNEILRATRDAQKIVTYLQGFLKEQDQTKTTQQTKEAVALTAKSENKNITSLLKKRESNKNRGMENAQIL